MHAASYHYAFPFAEQVGQQSSIAYGNAVSAVCHDEMHIQPIRTATQRAGLHQAA
ncbi:hypothetical protein D3C78_1889050 [compost metagenome]